ncbi:hypothetical protein [Almyronema epifaneia]|uniref:Secreted protein n=1 Tax=Almyronema epifaneia S1 TaxID=2991925 RepID=A0ABW6IGH6_9CYAN
MLSSAWGYLSVLTLEATALYPIRRHTESRQLLHPYFYGQRLLSMSDRRSQPSVNEPHLYLGQQRSELEGRRSPQTRLSL